MNSYQLAMLGNVLLTVMAAGVLFGPFDLFGGSDDESSAMDEDQTVYLDDTDNDFLGGEGADTVYGGGGDDSIDGAGGNDLLFGGDNNDVLTGGTGDDALDGNLGDDTLIGGDGNDVMAGGSGTDVLIGGAGDDVISSDRLDNSAQFSRGEDETLSGGDGDDRLILSTGDTASGGDGQDTFELVVIGGEDEAVIEDFDTGNESLSLYYNPDDFGGETPEVSVSVDATSDTSQVMLDDQSVLTLNGVQDLRAEDIQLLTEDALA